MFNFWTKKRKDELQNLENNGWQVMNAYNNATPQQQKKMQEIAQNTASQNFSASEYNQQARANGEQDWNNAYRRDILWINDAPVETEAEKKRRLMSEYYRKMDEEYEKRKKENPETALPSYMEDQKQQENQQKEQVQNLEETQKEQAEQTQQAQQNQEGQQQSTNPTNIPSTDTAQIVNGQLQAQNQWQSEKVAKTNSNSQVNTNATNQTVDYNNWNVDWWKSRWSNKAELEEAIEKKYGTVATWWDDWTLTATIGWEKFQWEIDQNWNPVKTSLWKANQGEINRNQVFQMIQTGSTTDELQKYIHKHNLQDDPIVKNQITKKFLDDYEKPIIQKYSGYGIKELHEAVKNGELVPGSDIFNKLPQAEAYMKAKSSLAIIDAQKESNFDTINTVNNIDQIADKIKSKFFDYSSVEKQMEDFKNDPELKEYKNDLYSRQKKIAEKKKQLNTIWDNIRRNMQGANESMIQAEIVRQSKHLMSDIAMETDLMNVSLNMINSKKQDFEIQMNMMKYKDWLKKEQYMSALDLYKYEREKLDKEKANLKTKEDKIEFFKMEKEWEREKFKLQEESNRLTRVHNNELQKNILKYQEEIRKWQWSFAKYPNWVYFQRNDWTMDLVMSWDSLWIIPDSEYDIHPYKRDDWGVTYAYVNKKTNEMWVYSLDAFWNEILQYSWIWTDFKKYAKLYPNEAWPKNNNSAWITWNSNFDNPTPWSTAKALLDNGITYRKWTPRPANEWNNYVAFDSAEDWIKAHYIMLASSSETVRQRLKSWVWVWNMEEYAKSVFWNSWLDMKLLDTPLNKLSPAQINQLMMAQIQRESPWFYKSMIKEWWIQNGKIVLPTQKQEDNTKLEELDKTKFSQSQDIIEKFKSDALVKKFDSVFDSTKDLITSLSRWDGSGDMSAIFQYMKTLDPTSVVRESEFEMAAKNLWFTDNMVQDFFKFKTWDKLLPELREKYKQLALQYALNKANTYENIYNKYLDMYNIQIWENYSKRFFPENRAIELRDLASSNDPKRQKVKEIVEKIKKQK